MTRKILKILYSVTGKKFSIQFTENSEKNSLFSLQKTLEKCATDTGNAYVTIRFSY